MPTRSPISLTLSRRAAEHLSPLPPAPVAVYSQSLAAAVLTHLGYQLAAPLDVTLPYDLLGTLDPEMRAWRKIQVKQASRTGTVGLRRGDKRRGCKSYRAGDFDLLLVVDLTMGAYLIPYHAIQYHRSQVCVRDPAFGRYRVAEPYGDVTAPHAAPPAPEFVQLSLPLPLQLPLAPARAA